MKLPLLLCLSTLVMITSHAQAPALRTWTSADGKTTSAAFAGQEGDQVKLRLASGQVVAVALDRLSEPDRAYIKALPVHRAWPDKVQVSTGAIEVKLVSEEPSKRKFVYRSEAFEYSSQGKLLPSLMKEVARTFEATRKLVSELPWGVLCKPPEGLELYQAALYETRNDYIQAGGPTNSGGVYMSGEKIFKIPFESLGIKRLGQSFTKDENYRSDTLVHEITHQMMHDYLPYLPKWAIEGSAEYTEMLPYNAGKFIVSSSKQGLKDYLDKWVKRGRTPRLPSVAGLFRLKRDAWDQQSQTSQRQHELYQQSALLVYYFNHLDGDGSGSRWMKFMDATKEEATKWRVHDTAFKAYRAAMDEFFKLPGVKRMDNGRFSYPSNLTPPKAPESPDGQDYGEETPLKHLDALLDGRSDEQLQSEIEAKFAKIGVKLGK